MTQGSVLQEPVTGGRAMAAEIAEQPEVWRRSVAARTRLAPVVAALKRRQPRFVLLAARGTSDHAALYAKYLFEVVHGMPVGLVSPSTVTAYGATPDLRDTLLIAVSQSGQSPDLVEMVQTGRRQGAITLSVTNAPASPLAQAAELHIDVLAGEERAVAATKSYTAQLLALYLLVDLLRDGDGSALDALPAAGEALIARSEDIRSLAARYQFASRLVVTGRGYAYPTAREGALKLMETCYVSAQAFSGADLLHGPLAMVTPQVPVLAVAPDGVGGRIMAEVLHRLQAIGAHVFTIGGARAIAASSAGLKLPAGVEEEVSPLVEILPLQQLALHLAITRGEDPDVPRGLSKITKTL